MRRASCRPGCRWSAPMVPTSFCSRWRAAPRRRPPPHAPKEFAEGGERFPAMTPRRFPRLAAALLALSLAACETAPKLPLLSPIEQAREYGYSETQRGRDTYEVTYVAPSQRSTRYQPERDADANAARTRATDMALWRAAQIAQQHDAPGFRVSQTRAETEIANDEYAYPDPFYGPVWGPGYGRRRFYPYPYPYPYPASPFTIIQPRVSLDVE